jgi:hypothetical protein
MAFFGLPGKRTGFFNFYDHWDDYREFGLGPKPPADPSLWSQVRRPDQLGGGPPGILHYEPCINHPAWTEVLGLVVRELATVGYDGMFFDVNTQYCYCPHCQEKFDIYLLHKYGIAGLKKTFGTSDHRQLNIPTIYRDFENFILKSFKSYLANHWNRNNIGATTGLKDTSNIALGNDWRLLRSYMQNSVAEFPPMENFNTYLSDFFGGDQENKIPAEKKDDFQQTVLRYYFYQYLESDELASRLNLRFDSSDIKRRCCSNPRDLLLWVETQRFWCQSMADQFARLKREGRMAYARQGRGDDFYTVANLGSVATLDGLNKRRVAGIDLVHWAPMADLQMFEEMNQVGMLESGVILSNIFAFKWAMAAGTRGGPLLYKVQDDRAADLAHAEVAAGGGGTFIQPGLGAPQSRLRWKNFFKEYSYLWDNGISFADVGMLYWSDQMFYENSDHLASARAFIHILSENQIPFDIITEENLLGIHHYKFLIAPKLLYLDESQISSLLEYAQQGGNLIIVRPFGTEDKQAQRMDNDILEEISPGKKMITATEHGQGTIIWLDPNDFPKRQSDLWCLLEERANAFGLARQFLNNARRKDLNSGIDLGSGFIKNLEKLLKSKLRWCPVNTPASIYVNAYLLPAHYGYSEKIVVHVVNYNVPITIEKEAGKDEDQIWQTRTKSGKPVSVQNLKISIPLSRDRKVSEINSYSPTDKRQQIKWAIRGEDIELIIDTLEIYQAIVLEIEQPYK